MTISDDTTDLISTSLWGESVTVVRDTLSYGDDGAATDSWGTQETVNADIQPLSGGELIREIGKEQISTHKVFLPQTSTVRQGDRIRASGWAAGSDEYHVDAVMNYEDHVKAMTHIVKGHA